MNISAPLVNIKRFAVHDGPGIRTTLFLKGCPLRCIWCHNPESRKVTPEIAFRPDKCSLCGECAAVCECHTVSADGHRFDREKCVGCGRCVEECLQNALEHFGRRISVEEASALLTEDRMFYAENGGITISGGEPLMHSSFCRELLQRLREQGIHTAVDTCGEVPWRAFEEVLPFVQLFLYDFKCADSDQHKRLTGSGNDRILSNLVKLNETGVPIEIRMPMIPEHNMQEEYLHAAGKILGGLSNITSIRLLAYHDFARSKFTAIGEADTMPKVAPPAADGLQAAKNILSGYGLKVILPPRNQSLINRSHHVTEA